MKGRRAGVSSEHWYGININISHLGMLTFLIKWTVTIRSVNIILTIEFVPQNISFVHCYQSILDNDKWLIQAKLQERRKKQPSNDTIS